MMIFGKRQQLDFDSKNYHKASEIRISKVYSQDFNPDIVYCKYNTNAVVLNKRYLYIWGDTLCGFNVY